MSKSEVRLECKQCNRGYNLSEVRRKYGEDSNVYQLGYCSSQCYTKRIVR